MVAMDSGADNGFFYAGQVMHFSSPFTVFLIYHKQTGEFARYYEYFYDQLDMEYLKQDFRHDEEILELILRLIVETMCSNRKQIRIASDDKPVEIVRSTFMKLNSEHIRFVMDRFKENTTEIRNIKQYLLASIYNAPYTIDAHYDAQVRHDMASGKLGGRW